MRDQKANLTPLPPAYQKKIFSPSQHHGKDTGIILRSVSDSVSPHLEEFIREHNEKILSLDNEMPTGRPSPI